MAPSPETTVPAVKTRLRAPLAALAYRMQATFSSIRLTVFLGVAAVGLALADSPPDAKAYPQSQPAESQTSLQNPPPFKTTAEPRAYPIGD